MGGAVAGTTGNAGGMVVRGELVSLGRLLVANEAQDIKRRWVELEEEKVTDAMREKHERTESNLKSQANLRQMLANHLEMEGQEGAPVPPAEAT
jgi:hypothetical protein